MHKFLAGLMVALACTGARAATVSEAESVLQAAQDALEKARTELAAARKAEVGAAAKAPPPVENLQLVLPRLTPPPVIDGAVGEKEWARAAALTPGTGAANIGQLLRARPGAVFHLGWDPEHLYVAVRIPMRDGEKPVRLNREPKRDSMTVWETESEVYIDPLGNGSLGLPCRYQFIGTATGNQWDREDQYTIGQNMIAWDGEWEFEQQLSPDGKHWEGEFSFPRTTVYQPEPLSDGDRWNIGFAASLMHPWQWCGLYGYPVTAIFRNEAPSIRLKAVERGLMDKRAGGDLEIVNTTARRLEATAILKIWAKDDVQVERSVPVSLAPGEAFRHSFDEDCSGAQDRKGYRYTLMVLSGGKSLFTFDRMLAYSDPENGFGLKVETRKEDFPLSCSYYPLSNRASVTVDVFDLPTRDRVKAARFTVIPEGGGAPIAEGEITDFPYGRGTVAAAVPADLAPGKYVVAVEVVDVDGARLGANRKEFLRKDHAAEFPWLGNTIGMEDELPHLFQPVEYRRGVIHGHRKEIRLDGSSLPASVRAAGIELLSGPVHLRGTAGGRAFTLAARRSAARLRRRSPTHAAFTGSASGGPLKTDCAYRLDYDGTARIELTMAPAARGTKARLDSLQLVIPFRGEAATHFMVCGDNMRQSNRAGYLPGPGKTGTVWASTEMPAQRMTVGSFVPIVHVGNLNSGMTWFADSDEGWWPSDARPAIEIVRTDAGMVELVCNLASEPVEFDRPRKVVFGLCTVPVREVTGHRTTAHVIGFGFELESGRWDPKRTAERVYARVYPDDPVKFRQWVDDLHARGYLEKCYIENSSADFWAHEFEYFEPEWENQFTRSAADCKLYWTERFITECLLDGYYVDNIFCRLHWDPVVTTAYRLPDGRVQPGYGLWDAREYFRRIRLIFEKYRDPLSIVFHNTDFQFAPIMGYADLVMGGENPLPAMGTPDYMDMWPREWMDVFYNQPLWGYSLSHLYHYRSDSFKDELGEYDRAAALKGHRTTMASMLVHGVEFFHGIEYQGYLMPRFRMFKKLPGATKFIPSWAAGGLFRVEGSDADVDVAIYKKTDALLIIVANYSKQAKRANVWLDFPELLRLPGRLEYRSLYDFETLEFPGFIVANGGRADGTLHEATALHVDVAARDFRMFLLMNEPVAQGAAF